MNNEQISTKNDDLTICIAEKEHYYRLYVEATIRADHMFFTVTQAQLNSTKDLLAKREAEAKVGALRKAMIGVLISICNQICDVDVHTHHSVCIEMQKALNVSKHGVNIITESNVSGYHII